jgi:teichuronic acid biosynthesis glycosyltransferase TuaC
MGVRVVCSGNVPDFNFQIHQAFIYEQVESLKKLDTSLQFEYFFIKKGGFNGYLQAWKQLRKLPKSDIIHAHGGLASFLSVMLFRERVISTFHGSDINLKKVRWLSAIASFFSKKSIYVSNELLNKSIIQGKPAVIPCGVDMDLFKPITMQDCRKKLGLDISKKYLLFSSSFSNPVKNFSLLQAAVALWPGNPPEILELKNISRTNVPLYMNAANICVLCSFTEGSPQFIKEALACNRPVVSTNVGDVRELFGNSENCRITTFEASDLCQAIVSLIDALESNGRNNMKNYDLGKIASQILTIYQN